MNVDLMREIEIADGVSVAVSGNEVKVSGNGKELVRNFDMGKVKVVVKDGKVVLSAKGATRRESKMIGTIWAHLKNMIKGVGEDFVYELEVCNVHFPMSVKVEPAAQPSGCGGVGVSGCRKKGDGGRVVVKSFLGETTERVARIMPGVNVDVKGNQIMISSHDIEAGGQTAANIEKATRLTGRDRRIFQDGIYITKKPGREI